MTTTADATARLVALYAHAGLAQRPRMMPREQPPIFIESAYAADLVSIVREWRAELDPLLADLPRLLARARRDSVRMDDTPEGTAVRSSIQRARVVANREARVSAAARKAGRDAAEHQRKQLGRQTKAALGVELPTQDAKVPTMVERFVERNVSKVEALAGKTLSDAQDIILRAFERGTPAEDVAAEISARFGIAERAARGIAANQLTNLTAQVRRERHLELGITTFRWRNSPEHIRRGVVRPSHAVKHDRIFPYEGSRAPSFMPGEEPHCVPGDIPVSLHAPALKAYRRWHRGELSEIVADSIEPLRCTHNHPVLTSRGWRPAHLVKVGDYIVKAPSQCGQFSVHDPQRRNTNARQVFGALLDIGTLHRVAGRASWFHGDAVDQDVDVVTIDWSLLFARVSEAAKMGNNDRLSIANQAALGLRLAPQLLRSLWPAAYRVMCGLRDGSAFLGTCVGHANEHSLAAIALRYAVLVQNSDDLAALKPEFIRDLLHADPGLVHANDFMDRRVDAPDRRLEHTVLSEDGGHPRSLAVEHPGDSGGIADLQIGAHRFEFVEVIRTRSHPFSGYVYNFETVSNWFGAHNLVLHNCGCTAEPVLVDIKSKAGALAGKGVNRRRRTDARLDAEDTMRIAIAGGPRCGKTTLAETLGAARHTDDLIERGWSEASALTATWFDEPGPWIIEGVAVPRALRKWLAANPEGRPCDVVHWLGAPRVPLTDGQVSMFKGCAKVWGEIVGELQRRGVEIR